MTQHVFVSWHDALKDWSRQLSTCAEQLEAPVPPGHVDYISKGRAAKWCAALAREMAQLRKETQDASITDARKGGVS